MQRPFHSPVQNCYNPLYTICHLLYVLVQVSEIYHRYCKKKPCRTKAWFTLVATIGDFILLTYVNEYVNKLNMGQILNCFCKGIEFTHSHRREEAIPDS